MGVPTFEWGSAHPSLPPRFGSKLPLPLRADVRLHMPMIHRDDDAGRAICRRCFCMLALDIAGVKGIVCPSVADVAAVRVGAAHLPRTASDCVWVGVRTPSGLQRCRWAGLGAVFAWPYDGQQHLCPSPPAMLFINENEKYICTYFGSSREDTDVGDALSLLLPEYGCNSPRPIVVFSRCCALQSPMYAEVRNSDGSSHYVPRLSSRQSCGYLKMISKAPDRCQG